MDTHREHTPMAPDAAERIVGFLAGQGGIGGTVVAAPDGSALAAKGASVGPSEAALAGFICSRADELAAEGDLRGMGKLVSEGVFQQLSVHSPDGDMLVVALEGGCLLLTTRPGHSAVAAQSLAPVIARFGRPGPDRRGG